MAAYLLLDALDLIVHIRDDVSLPDLSDAKVITNWKITDRRAQGIISQSIVTKL